MGKLALIAKVTAAAGKRDELVEAFGPLVKAVEDEPGTLLYVMHKDDQDDDVVWFYEVYADKAAMDAHSSSETMKTVGRSLAPLMGGRPELFRLTPAAGKGIEL